METRLWGQYTYPDNELGTCLGPVTINLGDVVRLELTRTRMEGDLTPTFRINSLFPGEPGTARLFADPACTQPASDPVPHHSTVEAYELDGDGGHRFWIKVEYENGGTSGCLAETLYSTEERMTLSHATGRGSDTTPTFSVGGLASGRGIARLFSDSACTAAASDEAAVDGTIEEITANRLSWYANNFYAKHTVDGNESPCLGPVSYHYNPLTLTRNSSNTVATTDPVFTVRGLLGGGGTARLFGDSSCTTAASGAAAVGGASVEVTANTLSGVGNYSFYAKHTFGDDESRCIGPVSHRLGKTLSVADGTTAIAARAYEDTNLEFVNIPSSVTSIGSFAFFDNALTSVVIPSSVTSIGDAAFAANKLTSVVIPNSVTSIGGNVFQGNKLTSVVIPNSVTSIGGNAFQGNKLASVVIPNSVTSIGQSAFSDNALTSVVIPNSVTWIGDRAFSDNALTSVVIPSSVTSIGDRAFSYNKLTSVVIPNSVTSIGGSAFSYNKLTSVVIPNSVTSIGSRAFSDNALTSVVIPNSVTWIGSRAFSDNALTSVVIPSSVTSIGSAAFRYNNNLSTVCIEAAQSDITVSTAFPSSATVTYEIDQDCSN